MNSRSIVHGIRITCVAACVAIAGMSIAPDLDDLGNTATSPSPDRGARSRPDTAGRPTKGIEVQLFHFAESHDPYPAGLPGDVLDRIWLEIDLLSPVNPVAPAAGAEPPWELIGPRAMLVPGANQYCGRVLDIEARDAFDDIRIASASGGLWEVDPNDPGHPVPLADGLETLSIGSFATHPTNRDIIVVGTGEPQAYLEDADGDLTFTHIFTGLGIYKTVDRGQTWNFSSAGLSFPRSFYRVRWDPFDITHVHAVCHKGYYRSDDEGDTFALRESGVFTDLAIHPATSQLLWAGRWDETNAAGESQGGIYQSIDGGDNWTRLTHPLLPNSDMGRISLAVGGTDPASTWIYAAMAKHSNPHELLAFVRSTDAGLSWADLTPQLPAGDFTSQGFYNNAVAVDPDIPETVFLGWIDVHRSTDSGVSWVTLSDPDGELLHPDQHIIRFSDQDELLVGNDGGVFQSVAGDGWLTHPWLPITQFYHLDISPLFPLVAVGGSQDNGISYTPDFIDDGLLWHLGRRGDGGDIAFEGLGFSNVWASNGVNDGDFDFPNYRSTDGGDSWNQETTGLPPSNQWFRKVATNRGNAPAKVLTHVGPTVYAWDDQAGDWNPVNQTAFSHDVAQITVVDTDGVAMWVTTSGDEIGHDRVMYRNISGFWVERSAGLPEARVRKVAGDRYGQNPDLGYAIMNGMSSVVENRRIWKTDNGGQTWINVTGNLPHMPVTDLVAHPLDDQILYVASETGCFKTTDGGASWSEWNEGWPRATIVNELVPVFDDGAAEYWIYAATFGRSAWRRNISPEPGAVAEAPAPARSRRLSAAPNPFSVSTTLTYDGDALRRARVTIHDVMGRLVRRLVAPEGSTSSREVVWDGRNDQGAASASGIYFARLESAGERTSVKLLRVP